MGGIYVALQRLCCHRQGGPQLAQHQGGLLGPRGEGRADQDLDHRQVPQERPCPRPRRGSHRCVLLLLFLLHLFLILRVQISRVATKVWLFIWIFSLLLIFCCPQSWFCFKIRICIWLRFGISFKLQISLRFRFFFFFFFF